jgi:YD repeat-containing protein
MPACTTRTYGFDANDNRLSKATAPAATDGSCGTSGATVVTRVFDTADRPVTGANNTGTYAYDVLGRTTTLPASDAPHPAAGNISLTYYDNDLAKSIAQGGTTTTYTLDALDRRSTEAVTDTSGTKQTIRHYADTSDNPTWVTQGTTTQRYAELIGGDLSLTVDQAGSADLTLANPHGDVVTTVDLPTVAAPATGISGWNSYDEYGNAATTNSALTGTVDYGWIGSKQRATTGAASSSWASASTTPQPASLPPPTPYPAATRMPMPTRPTPSTASISTAGSGGASGSTEPRTCWRLPRSSPRALPSALACLQVSRWGEESTRYDTTTGPGTSISLALPSSVRERR